MNVQKKNKIDRLYLCSFFVFLSIVISYRIDYQDSWILNGIFIPIVIYTIIFVYFFQKEKNLNKLVLYSSLYLISLNLVPGLKYNLFYGVATDHAFHYRFIQDILLQNMIPQNRLYSEIPLMHIFLASSAKLIGSNAVTVMKFILPFSFGVLPFASYTFSKYIFNDYLYVKYSILASVIPATTYFYQLGGTSFSIFLMLFFFLCIVKIITFNKNSIMFSLLITIFIFALILSHSFSPLILSITLFIIGIFCYFINLKFNDKGFNLVGKKVFSLSMLLNISLISYWSYKAGFFFNMLVKTLYKYIFLIDDSKPAIPSRFFEIPIISKCQVLFVFHISDIILFIFSIIGIYYFVRCKKHAINKSVFLFFILYIVSIFLLLFAQIIANVGDMEYTRFITYMVIICPIFVGVTFSLLRKSINRDSFFISLVTLVFVLSFFQYYPCQPLIPKMSLNNSSEDHLVDVNMVNSIYQLKVIDFIENRAPTGSIIGGDKTTLNQMHGFMNYTFVQDYVLWYSPLTESPSNDKTKNIYNFYVSHKPGKAGIFVEQLEFRTCDFILNLVNKKDLIYNNGESFVLNGMVS